jgi:hypothetical protein
VLLARWINIDAAILGLHSKAAAAAAPAPGPQDNNKPSKQQSTQNTGETAHHHTQAKGSSSSSSSSSSGGSDSSATSGIAAAVARLVELDVSDAVQLSAVCLLQLLAWGANLRRLGASGCTTLAGEGKVLEAYMHVQYPT